MQNFKHGFQIAKPTGTEY